MAQRTGSFRRRRNRGGGCSTIDVSILAEHGRFKHPLSSADSESVPGALRWPIRCLARQVPIGCARSVTRRCWQFTLGAKKISWLRAALWPEPARPVPRNSDLRVSFLRAQEDKASRVSAVISAYLGGTIHSLPHQLSTPLHSSCLGRAAQAPYNMAWMAADK